MREAEARLSPSLEPEQVELLTQVVEIVRSAPREQRGHFIVAEDLSNTPRMIHVGSSKFVNAPVHDVRALGREGLLELWNDRNGTLSFSVSSDGFRFYEALRARGKPAEIVVREMMSLLDADAFKRPNARGSSVFALSERRATSEMARLLAQKENESDLVGGVNLKGRDSYVTRTLLDLSQTATIDFSLRLGNSVLQRLGSVNELHKARVEQASFAVLKAHDVPSILVETAFISNPQEERRLNDQSYQDKLARALLDGIRDYIARHPPRPTSPLASN